MPLCAQTLVMRCFRDVVHSPRYEWPLSAIKSLQVESLLCWDKDNQMMSDTEYIWCVNSRTESVDSAVYRYTIWHRVWILGIHRLTPILDQPGTMSGPTLSLFLSLSLISGLGLTRRPDIMSGHYKFDITCRLDGSDIWTRFTKSNTECRNPL